jgi:hypothetical protein
MRSKAGSPSSAGGCSSAARSVWCAISRPAINHFLKKTSDDPKPFIWSADSGKIIAAVRRGHPAFDSIH